jgi:hypothetical protein
MITGAACQSPAANAPPSPAWLRGFLFVQNGDREVLCCRYQHDLAVALERPQPGAIESDQAEGHWPDGVVLMQRVLVVILAIHVCHGILTDQRSVGVSLGDCDLNALSDADFKRITDTCGEPNRVGEDANQTQCTCARDGQTKGRLSRYRDGIKAHRSQGSALRGFARGGRL